MGNIVSYLKHKSSQINQAFIAFCTLCVMSAESVANTSGLPNKNKLQGTFDSYQVDGSVDQTLWKIFTGLALVIGMGMAGYALLSVAGALIGEFNDLRSGKAGGFGRLVLFFIIGVALIIFVLFLVWKALDLLGV